MINSIRDVVENNLCISCGACCVSEGDRRVKMVENSSSGEFIPVIPEGELEWGAGEEFKICPGKGYPIDAMGKLLFADAENENIELGRWLNSFVARSLEGEVVTHATSGGVMTGIAKYLLEEGLVDGVVTTRMKYGEAGPRPESFVATTFEELREAQGSKYVPVPIFNVDLEKYEGKIAFIGTPCQIAALRLLQDKNKKLKDIVKYTIANFCGGFRDLRETDTLIKRAGVDKRRVTFLRYRGDGQPGSMVIRSSDGKEKKFAYPDYARMTGVIKHLRCRLCVDATGELADFSCGDAWIPEYLNSGKSWSIVIARSEKALKILEIMQERNKVLLENISIDKIVKSQYGNIVSKKFRQQSRIRFLKFLGKKVPAFDGGYYKNRSQLLLELKVHFSHGFFSFLERIGLYKKFAILIGRYPKG